MFKSCPVLGNVLQEVAQAIGSQRTQEMKAACHGSVLSEDLSKHMFVPGQQDSTRTPAHSLSALF